MVGRAAILGLVGWLSMSLLSPVRASALLRSDLELTTDPSPNSVAAADLNRDGIVDLVTANWTSNDVSVILGEPGGGFSAQVTYPTDAEPNHVVITDINSDGLPDLLTANWSG